MSKARYRAPRHHPIAAMRRENPRPALPSCRRRPPQPARATPPEPSPAAADRQIPIATGTTAYIRPAVSSLEACPTPAVRARRSHRVTADVRQPFTTADLQRPVHLRPLSGVKQTSNVRFLSPKRSCADDVRLRGKSGLSGVTLTTSASSQQQTLETCPDDGQQAYSSPARLSWSVKRSSCFWSLYGCDSANAAKLKSGWFLSTFRAALRASSP